MSTSECIFCKIVSGDIPAKIAHRDDQVTAFHDIRPVAPVHILVIPNRHIPSVTEATRDDAVLLGTLLRTAAELARQLGVAETGYRLVINAGADAGQSVDHIHVHLLGGRTMAWPPG